jgi:uncharacterized membrane protein
MRVIVTATRIGSPDLIVHSLSPTTMIALGPGAAVLDSVVVPEWIAAEVNRCAAVVARTNSGLRAEMLLIHSSVALLSSGLDETLSYAIQARCLYGAILVDTRTSSIRDTI